MTIHELRRQLARMGDAELKAKAKGAISNYLAATGDRRGLRRICDELWWFCSESGRGHLYTDALNEVKQERARAQEQNREAAANLNRPAV